MKSSLQGSLRIGTAMPTGSSNDAGNLEGVRPANPPVADTSGDTEPDKPYLSRLVLLVPAEIISLYVALKGSAQNFLPWFGLICVFLVVLVRAHATASGGKPEKMSVAISVVSFVLWLYSAGGSLPWLPTPADPGIIAVAIALWTFIVPYFYTGQPGTPATKP